MSEKPRILPRTWQDLEEMAGIKRTENPTHTRADIPQLRRKIIPSWGRKRRKFYGP